MMYQLGWATLPGLRGLSCSHFRAEPTTAPDNERGVAIELATELPKATRTLQEISPELSSVVGSLDERFDHIDTVVTELARIVEGVIGAIPGMRRVIRAASTASTPSTPN